MERIKITSHQLFSITALYTCGSSIIMVSAEVSKQANQDAWISGLITPIWGLFILWITTILGNLYPHMTFVEMIQKILGKWVGCGVASSFVFFCFRCAVQIPWFMGDFITTQFMPETPAYAVYLIFIVAILIAVLYGIEALARASEIFVIIVFALMLIAMLLVLPNSHFENLFPVLEKGMKPALKGSLVLSELLKIGRAHV